MEAVERLKEEHEGMMKLMMRCEAKLLAFLCFFIFKLTDIYP